MLSLLSSPHYSRSTAIEAFSRASQYVHVSSAEIVASVDAVCVTVPVDHYADDDRGPRTRTDMVRAVHAGNVQTEIEARHGALCSVCLCPCKREDTREPYRSPLRGTGHWLVVGNTSHPSGPVHSECLSVYELIDDLRTLDYTDGPGEEWIDLFPGRMHRALAKMRKVIPGRRRELRFRPRDTHDSDVYFSDLRSENSYTEDDVVEVKPGLTSPAYDGAAPRLSLPDDIPLQVWLEALLAFHKRADETEPEDFPLVERIARAILAERERCADIADAFAHADCEVAEQIARAIRAGEA